MPKRLGSFFRKEEQTENLPLDLCRLASRIMLPDRGRMGANSSRSPTSAMTSRSPGVARAPVPPPPAAEVPVPTDSALEDEAVKAESHSQEQPGQGDAFSALLVDTSALSMA